MLESDHQRRAGKWRRIITFLISKMLGFAESRRKARTARPKLRLEIAGSFMRIASAVVVVGALWAGGADASSFVVLPAMTDKLGPSMIEVGRTATPDLTAAATIPPPAQPPIAEPGQIDIISPSIIALGEPAVTSESVAAIGTTPKKKGPESTPMVIRGGMVGDAFSPATVSTPAAEEPQSQPTAAQAPSSGAAPESAPAGPPEQPELAAPAKSAIKPE